MIIEFHKGIKWNLPNIAQYGGYEYSPMLCCPECSNKRWYNWIDENKYDIVEFC